MFILFRVVLFGIVFSVLAFSALVPLASDSLAQDNIRYPQAVVELFTSQGCSSCPPADEIVGEYADNPYILAFSWHVDYWNYLGWSDTFSKPEFTDRQRLYAASFRRQGVYTPQAVINGRHHVVGSNRLAIDSTIAKHELQGQGPLVPISVSTKGNMIRIAAQDPKLTNTTTWVVYYDHEKTVEIERGENRGRKITYHNVVRDFSMLGRSKKNGVLDIQLHLDELKHKGSEACAIIVQKTKKGGIPGAIVAAGVLY